MHTLTPLLCANWPFLGNDQHLWIRHTADCQWRTLPGDFPKWRTVHSYWMLWSEAGIQHTSKQNVLWQDADGDLD